mmetsp:Transcript_17756/g.58095  ORF Transcript_17756/g.58095 Transcript_17756/m.58095 type:complete len:296 (+) Transcript_17756:1912-2799(+)
MVEREVEARLGGDQRGYPLEKVDAALRSPHLQIYLSQSRRHALEGNIEFHGGAEEERLDDVEVGFTRALRSVVNERGEHAQCSQSCSLGILRAGGAKELSHVRWRQGFCRAGAVQVRDCFGEQEGMVLIAGHGRWSCRGRAPAEKGEGGEKDGDVIQRACLARVVRLDQSVANSPERGDESAAPALAGAAVKALIEHQQSGEPASVEKPLAESVLGDCFPRATGVIVAVLEAETGIHTLRELGSELGRFELRAAFAERAYCALVLLRLQPKEKLLCAGSRLVFRRHNRVEVKGRD